MSAITPRLQRRIERDFPETGSATEVARLVMDASDGRPFAHLSDDERIQAAIVLYAQQDRDRLADALALARLDWRDLLVGAELADEDWPRVLDMELGPAAPDEPWP
jgi:hypothetical protein